MEDALTTLETRSKKRKDEKELANKEKPKTDKGKEAKNAQKENKRDIDNEGTRNNEPQCGIVTMK